MIEAGCQISRQPLATRIWRRLGFGRRPDFDIIDWRCDEQLGGFAPGALVSETFVYVDFLDRLRVLLSGKIYIEVSTKTDALVEHSQSRSTFSVLAPNDAMKR